MSSSSRRSPFKCSRRARPSARIHRHRGAGRSRASLGTEKLFPSPEVAGVAVPLITHLRVLFMHECGLAHVHVSSPFFDKIIFEMV